MRVLLILLLAAAFTVAASPSLRKAGLQRWWARDFPLTPYGFEPKFRVNRNGVLVDEKWT